MKIDLNEMTVVKDGFPEVFKLERSVRNERRRGPHSERANADVFNIKAAIEDKFSSRPGGFGRAWVVKNNNKNDSVNFKEIVDGFKEYYLTKV